MAKRARCGSGYWFRRHSALDCRIMRAAVGAKASDRRGRSASIDDRNRAEIERGLSGDSVSQCGCPSNSEMTGRYDIVLCSLALHHFSGRGRGPFAASPAANCRGDMFSSQICAAGCLRASAFIFSLPLLFRDPMTRNDGRVSAARAFSFRELHALAQRAGWKDFRHRAFSLCAAGDLAGACWKR